MKFFRNLLNRQPKVNDQTEAHRLSVAKKRANGDTKIYEPALREVFRLDHYLAVLKAREEWFQNTPQLWPVRTS